MMTCQDHGCTRNKVGPIFLGCSTLKLSFPVWIVIVFEIRSRSSFLLFDLVDLQTSWVLTVFDWFSTLAKSLIICLVGTGCNSSRPNSEGGDNLHKIC